MPQAFAGSLLIHMAILALVAGLGKPIVPERRHAQRVLDLGSVTIHARDLKERYRQ